MDDFLVQLTLDRFFPPLYFANLDDPKFDETAATFCGRGLSEEN